MNRPDFQRRSEIVLEKLQIPLEDPVDLAGRANPVVETELFCVLLAGRTTPCPLIVTVSIRITVCQANQVFLSFAFFPGRTVCSNYKEVGCVKNSKAFSMRRRIVQLDGRGLVVIFQYVIVVFQLQNRGQLNPVAFKLNGDSHFPTRIAPDHIPAATAHAPRRLGASDDHRPGVQMLNEQDFAVWVKRTSLSDPARSVVTHTGQPPSFVVPSTRVCSAHRPRS